MPEFIVGERKISHVLFGISVIVGFVLSWYFDNTILLILSTVYTIVLYVAVPRHHTKTGRAIFQQTFTSDAIIVKPITLTARSEKALKAKINNYEKTHEVNSKSDIIITKNIDHTEYSIILHIIK